MLPEHTLSAGDVVEMHGMTCKVHAVKLVEDGPKRMLLMGYGVLDPHPLDWMPEASVLRVIRHETGAAV